MPREIKKTIYLLNINNYEPEITRLTYPFIKRYAAKIGAGIHYITERKFPEWPITYEKLQINKLAQEHGNEFTIYIDSDTIIHPECIDYTQYIKKDTVIHNGVDMAGVRWKFDKYFERDARHIGSCNWFTVASDWCVDLWHPIDDLTPEEAMANIFPTVAERNSGLIDPGHLIDDYALSRNIARFGLKFDTAMTINDRVGLAGSRFLWHEYAVPPEQKLAHIHNIIREWKIEKYIDEGREISNATDN